MKVTNRLIVASVHALNAISNEPLFGGASAKIRRLKRAVSPLLQSFNEANKAIFDKYAVDGKIPEDENKNSESEYVDLLDSEVTIVFDTIDRKYLENDYIRISPNQLDALDWIITPDEVKDEK